MLIDIYRVDFSGMAADPDAAGPLTSGLDHDYREPVIITSGATNDLHRLEMPVVQVFAQIEPDELNVLNMMVTGSVPRTVMGFTLHFAELEEKGLVDPATGLAVFKPGDRIGAIRRPDGTLEQTIPDPPGLYVREALIAGIGFGGERNLIVLNCQPRDQGKWVG